MNFILNKTQTLFRNIKHIQWLQEGLHYLWSARRTEVARKWGNLFTSHSNPRHEKSNKWHQNGWSRKTEILNIGALVHTRGCTDVTQTAVCFTAVWISRLRRLQSDSKHMEHTHSPFDHVCSTVTDDDTHARTHTASLLRHSSAIAVPAHWQRAVCTTNSFPRNSLYI
jgi:hypothetical protein